MIVCEQPGAITKAAVGFVPNYSAVWRMMNAIQEFFFERRYVGDQAGPSPVARITLEYDDVVLWRPA